jgi:hypothetical protein
MGSFIGWMAKAAVVVAGAVSFMKAAGCEPVTVRNNVRLDVGRLLAKSGAGEQGQSGTVRCPPGKVMALEDGRAHCVVKERVEVPFDSNLAAPSAGYGLG